MNTQRIRVLFKAIELGSMTKAGDTLGYSQSAVTQMISSLEESFGFSLLSKTNRGVELTSEGEHMLPYLRKILDAEEASFQEAAEIAGIHKGTLWVGSFVSTSVHWLPKVLKYFQMNYPDVKINIVESGQDDLIKALHERSIDVALLSDPSVKSIEFIPVMRDPIVVAYSKQHDLSSYDRVNLDDIKDYPFFLTDKTYDRDIHRLITDSGFSPEVKYTSRDDYAVLSMVKNGLGITLIPRLVVEGFSRDFSYKLLYPEFFRTLGVGVRSGEEASPLVRFFVKYIVENISDE